jgi:hypothetical protein
MNIPHINVLQKWAAWLVAGGMVLAFSVPAEAGYYASCEAYVAGSSGIPSQVADLMHKRGDAAAYACIDFEGKIGVYSPATTVREGAMHVCSYETHSIVFPVSEYRAPLIRMALPHQHECPPQSVRSYVETRDVSEGVFAALVDFSDRICLDPKSDFRSFVSPTAADAEAIAKKFAALCGSLPASHPSLRDWFFDARLDVVSSERDPGYLSYELAFGDFGEEGKVLSVWVDLEQGQVKVIKADVHHDLG